MIGREWHSLKPGWDGHKSTFNKEPSQYPTRSKNDGCCTQRRDHSSYLGDFLACLVLTIALSSSFQKGSTPIVHPFSPDLHEAASCSSAKSPLKQFARAVPPPLKTSLGKRHEVHHAETSFTTSKHFRHYPTNAYGQLRERHHCFQVQGMIQTAHINDIKAFTPSLSFLTSLPPSHHLPPRDAAIMLTINFIDYAIP